MIVIGIDIGGTSIKGAAINELGKVLDRFSLPVIQGEDQEITVKKLADTINNFKKEHDYDEPYCGVGIGVPGIIDSDKGIVCSSANLRWENLPLKKMIEEQTGLATKITNDANAAALGETVFGSGKNYHSSVMITLGTGVGGGVVIDDKLVEGNEGKGFELGHMVIQLDGRPCGCGRKGCFEQYASASALIFDTKEAMKNNPSSRLHQIAEGLGIVDGRVSFIAAKEGDEAAIKVVENYVKYLSEGLLNYCNIFRPEVIILSGGIANEGKYLTDKIIKYFEEHHYGYYGNGMPKVDVVIASLGYDSGKIGAAALFLK
ncbi:MAG: ROK family protein [Bacilli bacterium]|nr:ROK family protein [Bacilli bacterium]